MKIRVVIVNIEEARDILASPERFCSKHRLASCKRIGDERRRLQGYAAELALSYALSGPALLPPVYSYEKSGRPVIGNGFISLSHSGGMAVCALSDSPVGIDVEAFRRLSPRVMKRVLSPIELQTYAESGDPFYPLRRFVAKEAFLKMTGEGVTGGLSGVEERDGIYYRSGSPAGFAFTLESDGYFMCVASPEPFEVEIVRFDPQPIVEEH